MASNPSVYPIAQEIWFPIAVGVKNGTIIILKPSASYRITYRVAGDPPPSTQQETEDAPKVQSLTISIQSDTDIDVYIYAVKGEDGEITVYL